MEVALSAIIAATVSWAGLMLLRRSGRLPSDHPNDRSLHAHAMPRGGGLAVWVGWFAASIATLIHQAWFLPLLLLIAISLLDDRRGVPAPIRLLAHLAAAVLWLWLAATSVNPIVTAFAIVWMANLFNFMDGSDGLAASMSLIGFGAYAVAAWSANSALTAALCALIAALAPFFFYNFPPARIFLGDVGSVPLGFLAAVFGIEGWQHDIWPAWFPVLVFLPFIADASVTLAQRALYGARIWQAHREHHYQKIVQLGFGHRGTLALYAALMAGTALTALAALLRAPGVGHALLFFWTAVLVSMFSGIGYYWRRRNSGFDESKG